MSKLSRSFSAAAIALALQTGAQAGETFEGPTKAEMTRAQIEQLCKDVWSKSAYLLDPAFCTPQKAPKKQVIQKKTDESPKNNLQLRGESMIEQVHIPTVVQEIQTVRNTIRKISPEISIIEDDTAYKHSQNEAMKNAWAALLAGLAGLALTRRKQWQQALVNRWYAWEEQSYKEKSMWKELSPSRGEWIENIEEPKIRQELQVLFAEWDRVFNTVTTEKEKIDAFYAVQKACTDLLYDPKKGWSFQERKHLNEYFFRTSKFLNSKSEKE